jgi:hypothetical protein
LILKNGANKREKKRVEDGEQKGGVLILRNLLVDLGRGEGVDIFIDPI